MASHNDLLRSATRPYIPSLMGGVAALALAGGAVLYGVRSAPKPPPPHSYQLTLSVERRSDAIYYTAFEKDVAYVDRIDQPITFKRDFTWSDGCAWQAVEEITPDEKGLAYHYAEHPESCPDGEKPDGSPSVLHGRVIASELSGLRPATSLGPNAPLHVIAGSQTVDDFEVTE